MSSATTYSVKEAAKMLGVSLDTAYNAARTGQIPSIQIGKKRILIPAAAFDRLLAEGNNGAGKLGAI